MMADKKKEEDLNSTFEETQPVADVCDKQLSDFLKKRSISESVIQKLEKEKIDSKVITMMTPTQLEEYFPAYGDRIAIKAFCKLQENSDDEKMLPEMNVFQRLKNKLAKRKSSVCTETNRKVSKTHLSGNKHASKDDRRIELGWMHYCNGIQDFKQVRTKKGGGTRHISISKWATEDDILNLGKLYFFPENISSKGHVSEFNFSICDFKGKEINNETIEGLYKKSGLKMLRFYFCSKRIKSDEVELQNNLNDENSVTNDYLLSSEHTSADQSSKLNVIESINKTVSTCVESNESKHINVLSSDNQMVTESENYVSMDHTLSIIQYNDCSPVPVTDNSCSTSVLSEVQLGRLHEPEDSFTLSETIPISPYTPQSHLDTASNLVTVNDMRTSREIHLPTSHYESEEGIDYLRICIHRINIQAELIAIFKAQEIIKTPIKVSFVNEIGSDVSGVSRDAYTTFWKFFFNNSSDGEYYKVPAICPEYGIEEWQAVGRILVKGFIDHRIFPHEIAPAYFITLMLGEEAVVPSDLLDSFFHYISDNDRNIIKSSLNDIDKLTEEDRDTLMDIFEQEGVKTLPTKETIEQIVLQMAHKCIIQKNSYALRSIEDVARNVLTPFFPDISSIKELYERVKPSCKKVINLLQAFPESDAETQALRYLHKYIRAQNNEGLSNFLHFVTASRIIVIEKISVEFSKLAGFERRPVARTCGPVLELPSTYTCYRELRIEFDEILSSGYLNIDIV